MTYHLTTLHADGRRTTAQQDDPPSLEQLQAAVGGYIEAVPHMARFEGRVCQAFCDEEGKLTGKPLNDQATRAWYECLGITDADDHLVGDVIVVAADSLSELGRL